MLEIDRSQSEKWLEKLVYNRQPPMFDKEIVSFQNRVNNHGECDPLDVQARFVKVFDQWLNTSKTNRLTGLDKFEHRDFCVGVTGFLDDLYVMHGPKIRYLKHEYSYHWRLNIGKRVDNFRELVSGDHLIVSSPFCFYGDLHPDMEAILDHCDQTGVHVHIDSAWYGCVRDFHFNYDRACIQSAGFSLSKGLSSGHNRIGIRFAKAREQGPITIVSDFNMGICHLMVLGIEMMNKFSADFLQEKYGSVYAVLCETMGLKPTKAIHVAFGPHPDNGESVPVGVTPILRSIP